MQLVGFPVHIWRLNSYKTAGFKLDLTRSEKETGGDAAGFREHRGNLEMGSEIMFIPFDDIARSSVSWVNSVTVWGVSVRAHSFPGLPVPLLPVVSAGPGAELGCCRASGRASAVRPRLAALVLRLPPLRASLPAVRGPRARWIRPGTRWRVCP